VDEPSKHPGALLVCAIALVVLAAVLAFLVTKHHGHDFGTYDASEEGEGCPCGCDHSEAMVAVLRDEEETPALGTIEETLTIIAKREDAGYITEAMVQHRLRMLALKASLAPASRRETPAEDDRGVPLPAPGRARRMSPAVEDDGLFARCEMTAHGEATEVVRGREKRLRPSFRVGLELENTRGAAITLDAPVVEGREGFPVSRWYLLGGDGRPWDGVIAAGQKKSVNVIGYLGERVQPGAKLDATVHLGSLVLHAATRARKRWDREE
jgi:hypothetical protein